MVAEAGIAALWLQTIGFPLAWHKVRGGVEDEWIGYWLDLGKFELGVSASRAAWASNWLADRVRELAIP